jgi:hypothetical protein
VVPRADFGPTLCRVDPEGASVFELHLHRQGTLVLVVVTALPINIVLA